MYASRSNCIGLACFGHVSDVSDGNIVMLAEIWVSPNSLHV